MIKILEQKYKVEYLNVFFTLLNCWVFTDEAGFWGAFFHVVFDSRVFFGSTMKNFND